MAQRLHATHQHLHALLRKDNPVVPAEAPAPADSEQAVIQIEEHPTPTIPETADADTWGQENAQGSLLRRGGYSVNAAASSGAAAASSSSGPSTSTPSSSSSNNRHTINVSVPVALGLIIPIAIAIVLFVILHRRHVKRMRREDANDPHKSLDFGWDPQSNIPTAKRGRRIGGGKKGQPEMAITDLGLEKSLSGRGRGMSLDIMGSPYLLPPGLHGSRESLHSMSRTINNEDDRYRPATTYHPQDGSSLRSQSQTPRNDDASSSNSGGRRPLVRNAQRMSTSRPPVSRSPLPTIQTPPPAQVRDSMRHPSMPDSGVGLTPPSPKIAAPALQQDEPEAERDSIRNSFTPGDDFKSDNYMSSVEQSRQPSAEIEPQELPAEEQQQAEHTRGPSDVQKDLPPPPPGASSTLMHSERRKSPPPAISTNFGSPGHAQADRSRQASLQASQHASFEQAYDNNNSNFYDDGNHYDYDYAQHNPHEHNESTSSQEYMPAIDEYAYGDEYYDEQQHHYDDGAPQHQHQQQYPPRWSGMGMRPLPPEDPSDNPEQRANRIRSFYKEYFDENRPNPAGEYYEDYDENYLGDSGAIWDPYTEQFVTSAGLYSPTNGHFPDDAYASRRAMTPPPRRRQHAATMSGGSGWMMNSRTPRPYSSASNQMALRMGQHPRGRAAKKLPPPKALRMLPTPHMLKEDAFALPIDFAPPSLAKTRRAGRPESSRGGKVPYSPGVRAHTPLATSYDDLAVMPSPHMLRRSGTFTALDFAPPPRIRDAADGASSAGGSETGSIRSTRTGMSARSQYALRQGAYRMSRIPKEVVGTKGDLMQSLRPTWNMHNNTGTIGMPT